MKTVYAQSGGADGPGRWYSAPSGGVVSTPGTGDILDLNGHPITSTESTGLTWAAMDPISRL